MLTSYGKRIDIGYSKCPVPQDPWLFPPTQNTQRGYFFPERCSNNSAGTHDPGKRFLPYPKSCVEPQSRAHRFGLLPWCHPWLRIVIYIQGFAAPPWLFFFKLRLYFPPGFFYTAHHVSFTFHLTTMMWNCLIHKGYNRMWAYNRPSYLSNIIQCNK